MSPNPAGKGRQSLMKMQREKGKEMGECSWGSFWKSWEEKDHLRFAEKMKYDGVCPGVITDKSGYKKTLCPKWWMSPEAERRRTTIIVILERCGDSGAGQVWLAMRLSEMMLQLMFYISPVIRQSSDSGVWWHLIALLHQRRQISLSRWGNWSQTVGAEGQPPSLTVPALLPVNRPHLQPQLRAVALQITPWVLGFTTCLW